MLTRYRCLHVALGALMRYHDISRQHIPQDIGIAILNDAEFNEDDHPDGILSSNDKPRRFSKGKQTKEDRRVVREDPRVVLYDPHRKRRSGPGLVIDRLHVLFPKGTKFGDGEVRQLSVKQKYHINKNDPKLSAQLVWSDLPTNQFQTHMPAREKPKDRVDPHDAPFRSGINPFRLIEKTLGTDTMKVLEDLGAKTTIASNGDWELVVYCRVVVKYEDGELKFGWAVNSMGSKKRKRTKAAPVFLWEGDTTVWDGNHSEWIEEPQDTKMDG
jgi:hypothetical protein